MIAERVRALPGLRRSRGREGHRIALSPACWGVSDVPGWGHQLAAERVLSEAAAVADAAITAGPQGFLPDRSDQAKPLLRRHGVRLVSGQVHAILHNGDIRASELAHIDGHAHWLAALGAETLVLSAIPERTGGGQRKALLSNAEWAHLLHLIGSVEHVCARHKLKLAVQPRFGSTIQGPEDIERLLVGSEAGLCVDVAHLILAGADPIEVLELAGGRIRHVHLNDIDAEVADDLRTHRYDYSEAVSRNLFLPLGEGSAQIDLVVESLRATGYRGWYTLEQDTRLMSSEDRPLGRISRSLEYLLPLLS